MNKSTELCDQDVRERCEQAHKRHSRSRSDCSADSPPDSFDNGFGVWLGASAMPPMVLLAAGKLMAAI
jgi:hypothetical protein